MDCQRINKVLLVAAGVFLSAVSGVNASAQLELAVFVNSARGRNYDIRISQYKLRAREGRKSESWGAFFPRLSASYTQNYLNRPTEMEFTMPIPLPGGGFAYETASISMGQKDSYQGKLSVDMPVFTFGALRNSYKLASLAHEIDIQRHETTELNIISGLRRGFYGYILAEEIYEITKFQLEKFEDNLRTAERLYRSGAASSIDVARVKVQLANTRSALIDADTNRNLAREQIFSLSGLQDSGEKILGKLNSADFSYGLDELLAKAAQNRAEIKISSLASDIQETSRRLERSVNLPKVFGYAGYIYERPYLNTDEWGDYWMAGVAVEFPFLDGLSVFGREKRTGAQLEAALIEEEKTSEAVRLQVKNSYYSIRKAMEKLSVQEENLVVAKNNMDVSSQRYSAGLLSNLEYNQAVLDYTAARMYNALTRFELISALEDLKTAVGKELDIR